MDYPILDGLKYRIWTTNYFSLDGSKYSEYIGDLLR